MLVTHIHVCVRETAIRLKLFVIWSGSCGLVMINKLKPRDKPKKQTNARMSHPNIMREVRNIRSGVPVTRGN